MKGLLYKKHTIFIADDDNDDVYFVKSAIEELDLEIQLRHFENGKQLLQGLNNAEGQLPNFVLMDLNMPVMDGKETLRAIRQSARYNDLPVIIFSTSSDASEKNLCYAYGATNYITKPYHYKLYVDILRKLEQEWIDEVAHQEAGEGHTKRAS
jgi:CheY-like chemotaxis protein